MKPQVLVSSFFVSLILFSGILYFQQKQSYGSDGSVFIGGQTYRLSGSGITSSATSIGLTSFGVYQNDGTFHEFTTSEVAGTSGSVYLTIEPGNPTRQEFVSCTTVTQGAGIVATLSGCSRGLAPIAPYTASTTYAFPHSGGQAVIASNSPAFYAQFLARSNDETISGDWDFTGNPTLDTDCTVGSANDEICAKAYIDAKASSGAADANLTTKGLVEIGTQTQTASSTTYGETGAYLAIPSNMATDTPNTATRASRVLMSDLTGYIKQRWINLDETFTWLKAHIFQALVTMNGGLTSTATTTVAGSSVTSNALVINTLPFAFSSTRSASSTVLMEDGSGNARFLPLSPSSTFSDPTRAVNTNYQNTTGRPLFVTITASLNSTEADSAQIDMFIGPSIYSMTQVASAYSQITQGGFNPEYASYVPMTFIVPKDYYYIASSTVEATATANIAQWVEIQI
jgi:hypothetical protein